MGRWLILAAFCDEITPGIPRSSPKKWTYGPGFGGDENLPRIARIARIAPMERDGNDGDETDCATA